MSDRNNSNSFNQLGHDANDEEEQQDYNALSLANHILESLGQDFTLDNEDYLYK